MRVVGTIITILLFGACGVDQSGSSNRIPNIEEADASAIQKDVDSTDVEISEKAQEEADRQMPELENLMDNKRGKEIATKEIDTEKDLASKVKELIGSNDGQSADAKKIIATVGNIALDVVEAAQSGDKNSLNKAIAKVFSLAETNKKSFELVDVSSLIKNVIALVSSAIEGDTDKIIVAIKNLIQTILAEIS